jgi:hypothetical protein
MAEPLLITLTRWEAGGAIWRAKSVAGGRAVVELLTCHGELVEELCSDDPELLRYLASHPRSDPD